MKDNPYQLDRYHRKPSEPARTERSPLEFVLTTCLAIVIYQTTQRTYTAADHVSNEAYSSTTIKRRKKLENS